MTDTSKPKFTPGPWREGNACASVVSDSPEGIFIPEGINDTNVKLDVEYYGGYLVGESISPCNRPLIIAAPELYAALKRIVEQSGDVNGCRCTHDDAHCCERVGFFCARCIAAIALAKAEGRS